MAETRLWLDQNKRKNQVLTEKAYTSDTKTANMSWTEKPQCGHLPCVGCLYFNIWPTHSRRLWSMYWLKWTLILPASRIPKERWNARPIAQITGDSQAKLQQQHKWRTSSAQIHSVHHLPTLGSTRPALPTLVHSIMANADYIHSTK